MEIRWKSSRNDDEEDVRMRLCETERQVGVWLMCLQQFRVFASGALSGLVVMAI